MVDAVDHPSVFLEKLESLKDGLFVQEGLDLGAEDGHDVLTHPPLLLSFNVCAQARPDDSHFGTLPSVQEMHGSFFGKRHFCSPHNHENPPALQHALLSE